VHRPLLFRPKCVFTSIHPPSQDLTPTQQKALFSFPLFQSSDSSRFVSHNNARIDDASQSVQLTTYNPGNPSTTISTSALWSPPSSNPPPNSVLCRVLCHSDRRLGSALSALLSLVWLPASQVWGTGARGEFQDKILDEVEQLHVPAGAGL